MLIANAPTPHTPPFDDWIEGTSYASSNPAKRRFVRASDGKTLSVREDGTYAWTPDPLHPEWDTDGAYEQHTDEGGKLRYDSGGKAFVILAVGK